jgi:hypothetical protein
VCTPSPFVRSNLLVANWSEGQGHARAHSRSPPHYRSERAKQSARRCRAIPTAASFQLRRYGVRGKPSWGHPAWIHRSREVRQVCGDRPLRRQDLARPAEAAQHQVDGAEGLFDKVVRGLWSAPLPSMYPIVTGCR